MCGYFLSIDILGFREINKNLKNNELDARVNQWIQIVESLTSKHYIDNYRLVSDSLFVGENDTSAGLNKIIDFSKEILVEAFSNGLPLRGGISYGEYHWTDTIIFGEAVVLAADLERNQNWIGISCVPNLHGIEKAWDYEKLICYYAPLKHGIRTPIGVVSWDVPSIKELIKQTTEKGLVKGQDKVTFKFMQRIENLLIFQMYKKLIQEHSLKPNCAHGETPLQVIQDYLNSK